ncbi:hypothetical protein [Chishuiella sp.]|uniref:hypothetical protein n=1 Tax=Chishuiella sp. TaxID=1969467 RepID=UPI0028ABE262|nr:hypothetical protein [Chishuiella sp.]
MENFIKIIIYIHAFFGGLGLIAGTAIMFSKKGNLLHKKLGKIFSVGMLVSSVLSLFICMLPNHHNSFLLMIGVFTIYMILIGNRVVNYKRKEYKNFLDKLISGVMLVTSIMMIVLTVYQKIFHNNFPILLLIFGILGLFMSYKDFVFYKNEDRHKKWLISHVGKMVGAYIASVTAFLVAGAGFGNNFYAWILPSIIGTIYIIFWGRKLNKVAV